MGHYLGACHHGHGGLFSLDHSVNIIKGIQKGDTHLEIDITGEYLKYISPSLCEIYKDVKKLVADQALHLGIGDDWICIGDKNTRMVDDGDLFWDGPKPFCFGNISMGVGSACFLTGHLWNDYINDNYTSDNLKFIINLIEYLRKSQIKMSYHKSIPSVFISYSHKDRDLVDNICQALKEYDIDISLDIKDIGAGDSISRKVEEGIIKADYFLLVLSENSIKSQWVDIEYRAALNLSLRENKRIIPIVTDINDEQLLQFSVIIADKKYANFRDGIEKGLNELLRGLSLTGEIPRSNQNDENYAQPISRQKSSGFPENTNISQPIQLNPPASGLWDKLKQKCMGRIVSDKNRKDEK